MNAEKEPLWARNLGGSGERESDEKALAEDTGGPMRKEFCEVLLGAMG